MDELERVDDLKGLISSIKDSKDLYFLALMVISAKLGKGSVLPELTLLVNEQDLVNLLYYFAGETITFPTLDELKKQLYGISAYYLYDVKGLKWRDAVRQATGEEFNNHLSRIVNKGRLEVIEALKDIKLPSVLGDETNTGT